MSAGRVAPLDTRVVPRANSTFKHRRRGLSETRQAEFVDWLHRWGLDETGPVLDWSTAFDRPHDENTHVILDIGFGHGESTIELARRQHDRLVVGVEVHTPGVVTVLDAIVHDDITHVRVVHGDVLRFLTRVPSGSLGGVRVFFPDPWPKQKHHQRRLIRDDVVAVLTDRLHIGGELHLATDVAHYARAMQTACDAEARLVGGIVSRPEWRPITRFEQRGLDAGRPVTDLFYTRRS
jgi:tRNA (guanine-N7-)-methyltransferase